jgi:hypothetical protein
MFATLTVEQKCSLADSVTEQSGTQVDFASFCESVLQNLEEISGFETVEPSQAQLREIWLIHRERSTSGSPSAG